MPRHLLTVWNPSYAEDALDAHLRVLLRWAERSRDPADAATPEEDVYVWWAKIRSPRRDGELPHGAEIAAIQSQIDGDVETHLYLTDYRSLPPERDLLTSGRLWAERDADLRVDTQRAMSVAPSQAAMEEACGRRYTQDGSDRGQEDHVTGRTAG